MLNLFFPSKICLFSNQYFSFKFYFLIYPFTAFDYKNNRNIALKTENVKSPFPLTIYEANVACILNGYGEFKIVLISFFLEK